MALCRNEALSTKHAARQGWRGDTQTIEETCSHSMTKDEAVEAVEAMATEILETISPDIFNHEMAYDGEDRVMFSCHAKYGLKAIGEALIEEESIKVVVDVPELFHDSSRTRVGQMNLDDQKLRLLREAIHSAFDKHIPAHLSRHRKPRFDPDDAPWGSTWLEHNGCEYLGHYVGRDVYLLPCKTLNFPGGTMFVYNDNNKSARNQGFEDITLGNLRTYLRSPPQVWDWRLCVDDLMAVTLALANRGLKSITVTDIGSGYRPAEGT